MEYYSATEKIKSSLCDKMDAASCAALSKISKK